MLVIAVPPPNKLPVCAFALVFVLPNNPAPPYVLVVAALFPTLNMLPVLGPDIDMLVVPLPKALFV